MYSYSYALASAALRPASSAAVVFDFATGTLPAGFAVTRSAPAARYTSSGNLEVMPANTARMSYLPGQGATASGHLVEPAATNLLGHTVVTTTDLTSSGALLSNQSLAALGILPGVSIASTGADWNRALRNISLTAGLSYAVRVLLRAGSSGSVMVLLKNGTTSQSSQVQGTIGTAAPYNPQAGTLTVTRQELLKDGVTWALDMLFVPSESATFSVGVGPYTSVSGAAISLLAWQVEQASTHSSLIIDGAGTGLRSVESVTTPMPAGVYGLAAVYADGTSQVLSSQTLAASEWPVLSGRHVAQLTYTPT